jgi:sugar lactone lactonase YvrE
MVKETRILIFVVGLLCVWSLFSTYSKKAVSQASIPSSIAFSGESNVIYFLDRDNARLYRYNVQGRLTRSYTIQELGKNLDLK